MKRINALSTLALTIVVAACSFARAAALNSMGTSATNGVEILGTLDAPLPKGKNALWCGSFLAAWKTLETQVASNALALHEPVKLADALNAAADPRSVIPLEALYVAAGWKNKGIVEQVQREVVQKFPSKEPPAFPDAVADSFIAYSYLEASIKFPLSYFQNRQPLEFSDTAGRKTGVAAFGIRDEDDYAYSELRAQPRVLFGRDREIEDRTNYEFAVDLCSASQPSEIVVACIKGQPTLAAAVARVERESQELNKMTAEEPGSGDYYHKVGPNDVLLVPDILLQLSHRFAELEGKSFKNPQLKGQRLDVAQQDILFRLDRGGAELKSESKMYCLPIPSHYVFDRPFLVFMKKRGAPTPYFALWVDNAQILSPFSEKKSSQPRAGASVVPSQP